ncbi:hypothetical protein COV20_00375 [Candidatus Woesearchaeota archaeon CG10_big_fil_rev_8_21_14_0_10_45_16]|nr:MAG: hypothetical protein COV20_00375 [Candidatus Woesearchaeota archaeon CG10_big_fil_rev_8_21_14_0_10_45_16]
MSSLKTTQLLLKTAMLYERKVEAFNKREIAKKINQIKYLTKQKKVPRLTLQKQIVHLEDQLNRILDVEENVVKRENRKIGALKAQVTLLRKRLTATGEKDIHSKVEKLSHLLAECLAKQEVPKDVMQEQQIVQMSQTPQDKLMKLRKQIASLKEMLVKVKEKDPQNAALIEARLELLEKQLEGKQEPISPPVVVEERKPKHTILLGGLPLPPPPKMEIKG